MTDSNNQTPEVNTPSTPTQTGDANGDNVPDWLIPDRVYDILKWLAVLVLPALSVLVSALGPVWGWGELATQLATTITAVNLFLGAIIGASAIKASANK